MTLVFPPKSEWPTLTDADWASNRRHAFLKFRRLLLSMFTALDFVVGNENYGGEWALIYDTATRKTHKTYPPPTSAPRKRVHHQTQLFLHRILLGIFSDRHSAQQSSLTISRPASMTTRPCRTETATPIALVQPFSRQLSATVCLLTTRRR